jgi:uncharacterized protein
MAMQPITENPPPQTSSVSFRGLAVYLLVGVFFGIVLTKGEVVSWFRIQEMFRFGGFHMYGILGSALIVATASLAVIRRGSASHP